MMEQATQAIDDGEAEAKPATKPFAVILRIVTPVEFAEYLLALVFRNAGPCIPDFDAQFSAALATANQDTPAVDVPHRIGGEIKQDLLQEQEVTANPCVSWNDSKIQAGGHCSAREGRLGPIEQLGHRK